MIRKIFTGILMMLMLTGNSFAIADYSSSYDSNSKSELLLEARGSYYIETIDTAVKSFPQERLKTIQERINAFQINRNVSELSLKNQRILLYLGDAIERELQERKEDINVSEILNASNLTQREKDDTRRAILVLQNHLLDEAQDLEDAFLAEWKKSTHVRAEGNMDMNMRINLEDKLDIQMGVQLKDYITETHLFNQTLQSEIDAYYKDMSEDKNEEYRISSFLDFISKDGNIYMLFKNLNLTSNDSQMQEILNTVARKLNALGADNVYLTENEDNAQDIKAILDMWKKIDVEAYKELMGNTPLLEAYKKSDSRYHIIPTKAFCDMGKKISGIFDPLSPNECSQSQYEDFLQEYLSSAVQFSLELGNINTLRLAGTEAENSIDMTLTWNKRSLQDMMFYAFHVDDKENSYIKMDWDFGSLATLEYAADGIEGTGDMKFSNGSIDSFHFTAQGVEMSLNMSYEGTMFDFTLTSGDIENYANCRLNGTLTMEIVDLTGDCSVGGDFISYFIPNSRKVDMNMKLVGDTQNSKNNIRLDVSVEASDSKIFELKLENRGTQTPISESTIEAPAKTEDIESFTEELSEEVAPTLDPMY